MGLSTETNRLKPKVSRKVILYPTVFMLRRTLFIAFSIWLGKHPVLQMACHQVSTLLYLVYLSGDNLYASRRYKVIEVGSEFLGLVAAAMLQQCQVYRD